MACPECARELWSSCTTWRINGLRPGGFAQFAAVAANNVQHDTLLLPDGLDFDRASFVEPVACGIRAVKRQGSLARGDTLHILGLGSMGLIMTQLGRTYGATHVFGSDFIEERRRIACQLGADAAFDAALDVAAAVRRQTGGRGADVVIVCPGDPHAIRQAMDIAAPGGRVVAFTPIPNDTPLSLSGEILYFREVSLRHSYSCGPPETREALDLLEHDRISVAPLITDTAGLDGLAAALDRAAGKNAALHLKTIIHPWD